MLTGANRSNLKFCNCPALENLDCEVHPIAYHQANETVSDKILNCFADSVLPAHAHASMNSYMVNRCRT